jgi:exopolyphosphatase/guanosine-5'-triphosphate,3'-diphosphate pyrophosphatase
MISLPESVAAVDLGSNSFHMLIARQQSGDLSVVDRRREVVRLAAGLDRKKRIDDQAIERALDCLRRFGQRVGHMPPGSVRAVGTNTLRTARNADEFLEAAQHALGHPIDIISGMEEARLIYLGVAHSLAGESGRRLVTDIGGGSTELIIGEHSEPVVMESIYIGCVSMSRRFFDSGEIDKQRWESARVLALQELAPLKKRYRELGWDEAVGSSGTIRAVREVVTAAGWTKTGITLPAIENLRDTLIKSEHVERIKLKGLDDERAPVFPGGVVALQAIFETLGIESMEVAEGALREGVLYDLVGRIRHEDPRHRSVEALADRYHVDLQHAARVEGTALRCFDQVSDQWGLQGGDESHYLAWAARLHEIGLDIAHNHYHRHGAYVIEHADLFGFSRQEQKLVAALVRAHRRRFPTAVIKELPKPWRRPIEQLAILLRLAVKLHRSRGPEPVPRFRLIPGDRSLTMEFPGYWLDEHPMTRADLEAEAAHLKDNKFELKFSSQII